MIVRRTVRHSRSPYTQVHVLAALKSEYVTRYYDSFIDKVSPHCSTFTA